MMKIEKNWTDKSLVKGGRPYGTPGIHHPKCGRCNEESPLTMPIFTNHKEWHLCLDCISEIVFMRLGITDIKLVLKEKRK